MRNSREAEKNQTGDGVCVGVGADSQTPKNDKQHRKATKSHH
jgi:hypothetical protein